MATNDTGESCELGLDGEYYVLSGAVRRYSARPCGRRHSRRLVCKGCLQARTEASERRRVNPIIPDLANWVLNRDEHTCQACGTSNNLTIDHKTPVILGGKTDPDNLHTLCRKCNSSKGDLAWEQYKEKVGVDSDTTQIQGS